MTTEEMLRLTCLAYEKKLKKLMGEKKFKQYSVKVARKIFFTEIMNSPSEQFKNFALDNFDTITATPYDDGKDFPEDEDPDDE